MTAPRSASAFSFRGRLSRTASRTTRLCCPTGYGKSSSAHPALAAPIGRRKNTSPRQDFRHLDHNLIFADRQLRESDSDAREPPVSAAAVAALAKNANTE